ncbi:MAG: hypothetical protein WCD21_43755 [Streptomyces sp.]
MTTYDSDAALDALLTRADDAVLAAVEDGLDLTAGRNALLSVEPTHEWTPTMTAQGLAAVAEWPAAATLLPAAHAPAGAENALLRQLLSVLGEAGRAALLLHCRLDIPSQGELLHEVARRLRILADTARMRKADGPTALRTLEVFRQCVAQIWDDLPDLDGESFPGLAAHFAVFDELLVQAQSLVVRLFADDGETCFLQAPTR